VRYPSPVPRRRRSSALPLAVGALVVAIAGVGVGVLAAGHDDPPAGTAPAQRVDAERTPSAPTDQRSANATANAPAASMPVVRGDSARRLAVPILMYHVLGTPPSTAPLPELWVSKVRFREQLAALARAGYQAVTLKAVVDGWQNGGPLPRKPIVLSFDDGYLSHATVAAPAMRRYGWPGVVNLTLHNLGADGLPRRKAQQMLKDGWAFDSHTLTHPDLRTIDDARLREELAGSRREIRKEFGVTPRFFCYPAGKYDARVAAAVKAAGYDGATTVEPGLARRSDDPYELPRVRITNADSGSTLVQRLRDAS
jgi:peptidoglycan/xylan/chitin deacetylase (PgdA/CDA1 family)